MNSCLQEIKKENPLIHCITNPISMTQCANAILALGARPIMAEHPLEVAEITKTAKALLLNFGNISDIRMEVMKKSFEAALKIKIPVVIDLVGVSCSRLRRKFAEELLDMCKKDRDSFVLAKGNYSEIYAMTNDSYSASGVDADKALSFDKTLESAQRFAVEYGISILASGKKDIITNGERTELISNGTPSLSRITGTGCMLGAICAAFLSVKADIDAVSSACEMFGKAGERADMGGIWSSGTYFVRLMDELSRSDDKYCLYLVTDSTGLDTEEFLYKVEEALKGGVSFLQIREKNKSTKEYIELGRKVLELAHRYGVPLVVDDRVDVAMAIDADGVHLGAEDIDIAEARKLLGPGKIIGATAKTVEKALEVYRKGADYLGVGAIYPTTTKVKTVLTSVDTLKSICETVPIPVCAIGGLNAENAGILKGAKIAGICVVSAIMKASDPKGAARELSRVSKELRA